MAILCILALIVFSALGTVSAKYREYAKQAFKCFISTITLRKCDVGLEEKIRSNIVATVLPYSAPAAKIVNSHFELLSSLFVMLMLASSIYSVYGIYNFVAYGNCNGQEGGFCVFSDLANGASGVLNPLTAPTSKSGQSFGNANYGVVVYEFGCYSCPYTAMAEPTVQKLYTEYGNRVQFIYKPYPLPNHPYSTEASLASWCAYEQGTDAYMKYREALFQKQEDWRSGGNATLLAMAVSSGLNTTQFNSCFSSAKYQDSVDSISAEGKSLGIYATPAFFIGGRDFIGAVTYDQLKAAIDESLKNSK